MEPVVCVIPLIHYGSARIRSTSSSLGVFNREMSSSCCRSIVRLDRLVMIDDCEANDEDNGTFHYTSDTDASDTYMVSCTDFIFHFLLLGFRSIPGAGFIDLTKTSDRCLNSDHLQYH